MTNSLLRLLSRGRVHIVSHFTYIFINNIVSIAEEAIELLPESKSEILPSAEPVIDKSVVQKQTKPDKYINADALMSLSQQMKQNKNI